MMTNAPSGEKCPECHHRYDGKYLAIWPCDCDCHFEEGA